MQIDQSLLQQQWDQARGVAQFALAFDVECEIDQYEFNELDYETTPDTDEAEADDWLQMIWEVAGDWVEDDKLAKLARKANNADRFPQNLLVLVP